MAKKRAEILDKKARKTATKEETAKERREVPKIKGCHASIEVIGGCLRPKDPVPVANAPDGVKMACSNHNCPFASAQSIHKECFQKLTEKVVSMLQRTGSSSWTDEQRVENAWRKKGLTFVGRYITCPCGHGTQTLEDSENRWSRVGEVVLDPQAYETKRDAKIKKALTKNTDKVAPKGPKNINSTYGGREQAMLAWKLERMEYENENRLARGDSIAFPALSKKTATKPAGASPAAAPHLLQHSLAAVDDDGFTTVGKDGRAREAMSMTAATIVDRKSIPPLRSIVLPPLANMTPAPSRDRRERTVSSCSNTSRLTSSSSKQMTTVTPWRQNGVKREGKSSKESRIGASPAANKTRYLLLSGSEDEQDEAEIEEAPQMQPTLKGLREFVDEFHAYSGIGLWSESDVKELNQHLDLFKSDSALFQCRITKRKLKEPTLLTQLTPTTVWLFTTQANACQKPDIPPGVQLSLHEYYAIFYGYEVKHLDDPIIFCKDGTLAPLECVDMAMLTMA